MLVYGDHSEWADAKLHLKAIGGELVAVSSMPAGMERHAKLVGALIETGRLLQGVADAGRPTEELSRFLYRLAQSVVRSCDSGFAELGDLPTATSIDLPSRVELRVPEGFAFYAVYPEAYVKAARKLRLSGAPRIIGIRSIGTTLGAVAAAALGAPPPVTVRPFGDPYDRQAELPPELIDSHSHFVIVDEGPGLSGSSFGAVADRLEAHGVPSERIAFLPSHDGAIGPHASARHRDRWDEAQRIAARFDPSFLEQRFGSLESFSVGRAGERLKYLAQSEGSPVLLKFAGLGRIGKRKLAMARVLHAAGFVPEPLAFVHGFLVERWYGKAVSPRDKPVGEIAAYIATRARLFPAGEGEGASLGQLLEMAKRNASLALGDDASALLRRWEERLDRLSRSVVRVRGDNRLDRGKWLRLPGGRLLKADALDHHCAHDLIGCQDIAWDVAGATVEFELDRTQVDALVKAIERAGGRHVDRQLLEFCRLAYCCFRLGQAVLVSDTPDADRYTAALRAELHQHHRRGTGQESSVG